MNSTNTQSQKSIYQIYAAKHGWKPYFTKNCLFVLQLNFDGIRSSLKSVAMRATAVDLTAQTLQRANQSREDFNIHLKLGLEPTYNSFEEMKRDLDLLAKKQKKIKFSNKKKQKKIKFSNKKKLKIVSWLPNEYESKAIGLIKCWIKIAVEIKNKRSAAKRAAFKAYADDLDKLHDYFVEKYGLVDGVAKIEFAAKDLEIYINSLK